MTVFVSTACRIAPVNLRLPVAQLNQALPGWSAASKSDPLQ